MAKAERRTVSIEQESAAALAEHAYLNIGPLVSIGKVPSARLLTLREDILRGRASPQRTFYAGWIAFETGAVRFSELNRERPQGTPPVPKAEVQKHFAAAERSFNIVARKGDPSLRFQARLGEIACPLASEIYGSDDPDSLNKALIASLIAQGKLMEELHKAGEASRDPSFVDLLSTIFVLNDAAGIDSIAMPLPARFWSDKVDPSLRTHLLMLNLEQGYEYPVSVAEDRVASLTHLDPRLLQAPDDTIQTPTAIVQEIQLQTAYTLASTTKNSNVLVSARNNYNLLRRGHEPRKAHLATVRQRLVESLASQT